MTTDQNKTPGSGKPDVSAQTPVLLPNSVPAVQVAVKTPLTPRQALLMAAQAHIEAPSLATEVVFLVALSQCEVVA